MHSQLVNTFSILLVTTLLLAACGPTVGVSPVPGEPANSMEEAPLSATPPPTEITTVVTSTPTSLPPTEVPAMATSTPTSLPVTEGKGNADVLHVRAVQTSDGTWTFHVTVEHPDTGWDDYADGWDVVAPDGTVLKPDPNSPFTRLLLHPHESEQPFTRSQSGIVIPPGVTQVRVRAHDLVNGFGGREVMVDLTTPAGEGYEVEAPH